MTVSSHRAGPPRCKVKLETGRQSGMVECQITKSAGKPVARQGNVAEAVGTKKTNIKCGDTQVKQRRVGYPKYQGEPTRPSGQVGEPDVRERKELPLWQRTSNIRRSGRWQQCQRPFSFWSEYFTQRSQRTQSFQLSPNGGGVFLCDLCDLCVNFVKPTGGIPAAPLRRCACLKSLRKSSPTMV